MNLRSLLSNFNGRLHHTQAKHEFAPIENPFSGVSDIYSSDQLDNLIADAAAQLLSTQPPNHDLPIHQMSNMQYTLGNYNNYNFPGYFPLPSTNLSAMPVGTLPNVPMGSFPMVPNPGFGSRNHGDASPLGDKDDLHDVISVALDKVYNF